MKDYKKIGVIGMGYVGIPTSVVFANHSDISRVIGFQRKGRSDKKVELLNAGKNPLPMNEPLLDEEIKYAVKHKKFECTQDFERLDECDAILIAVQTPFIVDKEIDGIPVYSGPDYSHLLEAINMVNTYANFGSGPLISIESTISPGTTDDLIKMSLEENDKKFCGIDFTLAHAPERVTPGKSVFNMINLDRCIGGVDTISTNNAMQLYNMIARKGKNIKMTAIEAEITKSTENAIRDTQIAIANQIAMYCETLGANFFKVKEGIDALKGEGITRALLYPGSGVGGHCLVKDTLHLEYGVDKKFEHLNSEFPCWIPSLFMVSRKVNNYMPWHVVNLLEKSFGERPFKKVMVLGYASLKNTGDDRNTPTIRFLYLMQNLHPDVEVVIYDPHCPEYAQDFDVKLSNADAIVVMMDHDIFKRYSPRNLKEGMKTSCPVIIDTRNMFDSFDFMCNGFIYKGIGRGDIR